MGLGGNDDDIGTQTPRTMSPQDRFTRYLQYFRTEGSAGDSAPDSKLSGPKELQSFLHDSYDDYADDGHDENDDDDDDDDGYDGYR